MLLDWGVSIGRACRVLPFDISSYLYQSRRTDLAFPKKRIKEIYEKHVRYGYRRVYYILRRDGWAVNMKKVYRLYRELGLQLRNKTPKRRVGEQSGGNLRGVNASRYFVVRLLGSGLKLDIPIIENFRKSPQLGRCCWM